ncbi:MAG: hypothetical protein AB7V04_00545 [Desulfomonilaceae bacterium]
MSDAKKKRINLYIDQQLLDFGKRFSYVTGQSISGLVEGFLRLEEEKTRILSAESYLQFSVDQAEQWYDFSGKRGADDADYYDEYLRDEKEVEFCKNNPDSVRAKLRIQLLRDQEDRRQQELEKEAREKESREQVRQEFVKRWNETFK